ncbi:NAD kinase [Neomegalonema sp.]|uniref:NAD kinase n=1 Tax=Neomegalonema sp. TaxID=2039713 RepID=UPI0026111144|nr:NAD kinase [Neomegalonema sp.]MDD2867547.1 NAD kinase [Neomegalonema sp.]
MKAAFVASATGQARQARDRLAARYGETPLDQADVIVALGGDGAMLDTLHRHMDLEKPIYGMNCGSVGFLMNEYQEEDLPGRLERAQESLLHPLRMRAWGRGAASPLTALAVNEVSLLRESRQAAKLRIFVDGAERLPELICDGALVSTPAGSTAYNFSAHGPILPIGAALLALTPISAFRPRRWRGAVLPERAEVVFEVLEVEKRPVSAVADMTEIRDVARVEIRSAQEVTLRLLFDDGHGLDERILREQFAP